MGMFSLLMAYCPQKWFLIMMTAKLKFTASTDNLQLNMEPKTWPQVQYTSHLHSDFVKRCDNGKKKKKKSRMNLAVIKT
jgi:elongation factor P hydroxylase